MRTLWTSGRINPLCSQKTLIALVRVLAYPKFQLDENEIREVLDSYLLYVDVVDVPDDFGARLPSCRDVQDQVFLELAEFGDAAVLMTGDRDLLTLAGQVDFAIESPRQFKTRFEDEPISRERRTRLTQPQPLARGPERTVQCGRPKRAIGRSSL